jgi:hypothetical protein
LLSTAWDQATPARARVAPLGRGYLVVRSRLRITRDGGQSLLAVRDEASATRIAPVAPVVVSPWSLPPDPASATLAAPTPAVPPVDAVAPAAPAASVIVPAMTTPAGPIPPVTAASPVPPAQAIATHVRASSAQSTASTATLADAEPPVPPRFAGLIACLHHMKANGVHRVALSHVSTFMLLPANKTLYTQPSGKLWKWVQQAETQGLVRCVHVQDGPMFWYVELAR